MSDLRLDEALARLGLDTRGWTVSEPAHNQWLTVDIWLLQQGSQHLVVKRLARDRPSGPTAFTRHWSHDNHIPARWNYWARETLAYESGVADAFAEAGMRAPACLGHDVGPDEAVLALEFVDGTPAEGWDIATYAEAARSLGAAQAGFVDGKASPEHPWLSQDHLRSYSTEKPVPWELLDRDEAWAHPLVADNFPTELREAATELHARRHELYALVEAAPRTLCHLDFWTKNLIQDHDGRFVLLDWAFVGAGALGEDIGNLVPDAAFDHFIDPAQLPELRQAVLGAYLEGLESAGWSGDPRAVETVMAASAVKYDWLTVLMLANATAPEHRRYGGVDTIDPAELYRRRGAALLDNAQQALRALRLDRRRSRPS
jgi:hypothetical protein